MACSFDEVDDWYRLTNTSFHHLPASDFCIGCWTFVTNIVGSGQQTLWDGGNLGSTEFQLILAEASSGQPGKWQWICEDTDGTQKTLLSTSAPGSDSKHRLIICQRRDADSEVQLWFCEAGQAAVKEASASTTDLGVIGGNGHFIFTIGTVAVSVGTNNYGNRASELFIGNFSLSSDEITLLGKGMPIPALKNTAHGLRHYFEMHTSDGDLRDLIGGVTLTKNSAPTTAEHAPVLPSTLWPGGAISITTYTPGSEVIPTTYPGMSGFAVEFDLEHDGTFDAVGANVAASVKDLRWNLGLDPAPDIASQLRGVARPSQLTVTLLNATGDFLPEKRGAELVTNGSFTAWTGGNPDSWTVTGEVTTDPEVKQVGVDENHATGSPGTGYCNLYTSSAQVDIRQTILTSGQHYTVSFYLNRVTSGALKFFCGATPIGPPDGFFYPGNKTFTFRATDTSFIIRLTAAGDATIDNVSVKAVSAYYKTLTKGTAVRIRATQGDVSRILWQGKVVNVDPMPGQFTTEKTVTVLATDVMAELQGDEYLPALQQGVRVDEVISALIKQATIMWPHTSAYYAIEHETNGVLGAFPLLDNSNLLQLDVADTTLVYTGDTVGTDAGVQALDHLTHLLAAEVLGRFWWGREGKFNFHSRHHDARLLAGLLPFARPQITMDAADLLNPQRSYIATKELANSAKVHYNPREVGSDGEVLWLAKETPLVIAPGGRKQFTVRWRDPNNPDARIGALSVIPPLGGTDIIANEFINDTGADRSAQMRFSWRPGATGAVLIVRNVSKTNDWWLTKAQVRGTAIRAYTPQVAEAVHDDSNVAYDAQTQTYYGKLIDDASFAANVGEAIVNSYHEPVPRFASITFVARNASLFYYALTRTVGDLVRVTDSFTGHDRVYVLTGETHHVSRENSGQWTVTWALVPADQRAVWTLEHPVYGALDGGYGLAF